MSCASKVVERRTRASVRRQDKDSHVKNDVISTSPKWDVSSVDSGFCSDMERRVAKLTFDHSGGHEPILEHRRRTRKHSFDDVTEKDYRKMTSHELFKSTKGRHGVADTTRKSRTLPSTATHASTESYMSHVSLKDLYHIRVLGKGGYARVDLVRVRGDASKVYALKKMNKSLIEERRQISHVVAEKEVMAISRSKFIPRLYRTFHSPRHVFLLTEACMGGDLFSVLELNGRLNHCRLQYVICCVIEALDYLHNNLNVLHRDVKTENILLDHNGCAKLSDLGFCKRLPQRCDKSFTFCGTPGYVAPEILLRSGHGRASDFFSLGVVAFESATCRSPFRRQHPMDTHRAILRGIEEVPFPSFLDDVTVDLITRMCDSEPRKRLGSVKEVTNHPWFSKFDWNRLKSGRMKSPLLSIMTSEEPVTLVTKDVHYADDEPTTTKHEFCWDENF